MEFSERAKNKTWKICLNASEWANLIVLSEVFS